MVEGEDLSRHQGQSEHRLPTVSASQALKSISAADHSVTFGLHDFDAILHNTSYNQHNDLDPQLGLPRGQVLEICGPPGVGKTAFCLQASANVLHKGSRVTWIDASTALAGPRLRDVLSGINSSQNPPSSAPPTIPSVSDNLSKLHYYTAPTLSHLIARIHFSSTQFPPAGTSLVVIDGLSAIIDAAYPRTTPSLFAKSKTDLDRWLIDRRQVIIASIASSLTKLAAVKNVAVVVTCHVVTKLRGSTGQKAVLAPAIQGKEWENAMSARAFLFWDWELSRYRQRRAKATRFARVVCRRDNMARVLAFSVSKGGIREETPWSTAAGLDSTPQELVSLVTRKRPLDEANESNGEDSASEYGWADEEELAAEGLLVGDGDQGGEEVA